MPSVGKRIVERQVLITEKGKEKKLASLDKKIQKMTDKLTTLGNIKKLDDEVAYRKVRLEELDQQIEDRAAQLAEAFDDLDVERSNFEEAMNARTANLREMMKDAKVQFEKRNAAFEESERDLETRAFGIEKTEAELQERESVITEKEQGLEAGRVDLSNRASEVDDETARVIADREKIEETRIDLGKFRASLEQQELMLGDKDREINEYVTKMTVQGKQLEANIKSVLNDRKKLEAEDRGLAILKQGVEQAQAEIETNKLVLEAERTRLRGAEGAIKEASRRMDSREKYNLGLEARNNQDKARIEKARVQVQRELQQIAAYKEEQNRVRGQ